MIKDSDWLCPNCEIVPVFESLRRKDKGKDLPALRTKCDMCGGQYLIIEEVRPVLTGQEAGLKFNQIKLVESKKEKKEVQTRLD